MSWVCSLDRGEMHSVFGGNIRKSGLLEDQEGSGSNVQMNCKEVDSDVGGWIELTQDHV